MRKMIFITGCRPRRQRYRWPKRVGSKMSGGPRILCILFGIVGLSVILFLLLGTGAGASFPSYLKSLAPDISISANSFKQLLQQGLPLLELEEAEYMSPESIAAKLLSVVTTVNLGTPKGLLESQFSCLQEMEIEAVLIPYSDTSMEPGGEEDSDSQIVLDNPSSSETEAGRQDGEDGDKVADIAEGKPLVGLYTTHNHEIYAGEVKGVITQADEPKGVIKVAQVFENSLRDKYQIAAARSQQIHDYPDWNLSYTKSKETGKSLLSKNPSIQVLIDIHRDAGIKNKQAVVIKGRTAATVLIIVGSAQRLDNPNWEKNKEFADKVKIKMDELYPGLCRGVRVQTGRYNQHLHPHAILLEMGNAKNSLAEAEYSAELMAHVISEMLKDISAKKL